MPFAASHSTHAAFRDALDAVVRDVERGLDGTPPDLSFVFVSHAHAEEFEHLAGIVRKRTASRCLVGCTGETVVGGSEEVEAGPVLSLWSAVLPGAEIELFHVRFQQTPDGIACSGAPTAGNSFKEPARAVFCLGEPYSSVPQSLLERLGDEFPGVPVMGGMASGAAAPGENRLFACEEGLEDGIVGVIVRGGPPVRSIVSQGCRPIGTHYVVTKAEQNVIHELGGASPLQRLNELLPSLSERDQQLARRGLHLGLVMNEYQSSFSRGDFLISNLMGADRESGSVAIANVVRLGQTVQFHVRDAETADEDLRELLAADRAANSQPPRAALLFSCNGRGTRLFPQPHHDASTLQTLCGPIPLAGFFAQGELGPVGGKNHIHGYTASIALFE